MSDGKSEKQEFGHPPSDPSVESAIADYENSNDLSDMPDLQVGSDQEDGLPSREIYRLVGKLADGDTVEVIVSGSSVNIARFVPGDSEEDRTLVYRINDVFVEGSPRRLEVDDGENKQIINGTDVQGDLGDIVLRGVLNKAAYDVLAVARPR